MNAFVLCGRRVAPWLLTATLLVTGCTQPLTFPEPLQRQPAGGETAIAFDTNHDGVADFWQYEDAAGRKDAIAYVDPNTGAPAARITLAAMPANTVPHFVIALDGVPYEVVADLYAAGHFRFFTRPQKVICCFPAMTDLAFTDLFHAPAPTAYQALYFDRARNRLSDSSQVYLSGINSPWLPALNYRASLWWDAVVYLDPMAVFHHELRGFVKTFRAAGDGQTNVYSVGTAGLGTRGGRPAIEAYLCDIDRLCEQLIYQCHGRVNITVLADHGHDLVPNRRVRFDDYLRSSGFTPAKKLCCPRDVVALEYGLVTYAAFFTHERAAVAQCLAQHPDVDLVCYPDDHQVIILSAAGRAVLRNTPAGYIYTPQTGDPLHLTPILAELQAAGHVTADGAVDGDAFFAATVDAEYPDALARIWRAFHGLVERPPDVIANLRDGVCHGSSFFKTMIGSVTSTHGSLNRMNSTTFVLTTLGDLPHPLRGIDVMPALDALRQGGVPAAAPAGE